MYLNVLAWLAMYVLIPFQFVYKIKEREGVRERERKRERERERESVHACKSVLEC